MRSCEQEQVVRCRGSEDWTNSFYSIACSCVAFLWTSCLCLGTLLHHHHHRQAKPSRRFLLYVVARRELSRSIVASTGRKQRFVFQRLQTHRHRSFRIFLSDSTLFPCCWDFQFVNLLTLLLRCPPYSSCNEFVSLLVHYCAVLHSWSALLSFGM